MEETKMKRNKQEIIDQILDLLTELVEDEPAEKQEKEQLWKCSLLRSVPKP